MSKETLTERLTCCTHKALVNLIGADFADAVDEAVALIDQKQMNWISTEDRMPEPKRPVIGAFSLHGKKPLRVETGKYDINGWWRFGSKYVYKVEYWMPMPEPPEEDS